MLPCNAVPGYSADRIRGYLPQSAETSRELSLSTIHRQAADRAVYFSFAPTASVRRVAVDPLAQVSLPAVPPPAGHRQAAFLDQSANRTTGQPEQPGHVTCAQPVVHYFTLFLATH